MDDSASNVVALAMFIVGAGGREVLADQSTTVSLEASEGCGVPVMAVPFWRPYLLVEVSCPVLEDSGSMSVHAPSWRLVAKTADEAVDRSADLSLGPRVEAVPFITPRLLLCLLDLPCVLPRLIPEV